MGNPAKVVQLVRRLHTCQAGGCLLYRKEACVMKKVLIRRCPVCASIGGHAREVEITLRRIQGLDIEIVDGFMGEFTVLVDGREVARKDGLWNFLLSRS